MTATMPAPLPPAPHVDSIPVDFRPEVPSADPSLHNALYMGQRLWRIMYYRGNNPGLTEGVVSDLKGHYAEVTYRDTHSRHCSDWLDGRSTDSTWHRHRVLAALALSNCHSNHRPEWLAGALYRLCEPGERLRAWQCVARLKEMDGRVWHPKTIARAFRWLALYGMAVRTNKSRKGKWSIIRF